MNILSQPFRFNTQQSGSLAYIEQGTDAQKAQEIATFLQTERGERPIYQEFGIQDPSFSDFDDSEFGASFSTFYGDIELEGIVIEQHGAGAVSVTVTYV